MQITNKDITDKKLIELAQSRYGGTTTESLIDAVINFMAQLEGYRK